MFGLNLKNLRKQRGLSQGDIWENGLSSPSADVRTIDYVCGGASRCFLEYAFSGAGMYFDYGFVKEMRYAKAQFKKRQKKV